MREKAYFLEDIFLSGGKNQHLLSISHAPDSFAYIILCTLHDNPESQDYPKSTDKAEDATLRNSFSYYEQPRYEFTAI